MKTFKTINGQVGYFSLDDLQTFEDHYVVGDCVYPFDVLGTHTIDDYVEPDLIATAEDKLAKLCEVNHIVDTKISAAVATYPEREIETFSKQLVEATAYQADPLHPTPMLSAIAASRGVTVAYLSERIIINSDNFSNYCGTVIGHRQKLEAQINAAIKLSHLTAINLADWPV